MEMNWEFRILSIESNCWLVPLWTKRYTNMKEKILCKFLNNDKTEFVQLLFDYLKLQFDLYLKSNVKKKKIRKPNKKKRNDALN